VGTPSGDLDRAVSPGARPTAAAVSSSAPPATAPPPPATPPAVVPGTRQPPLDQLTAAARVAAAFLGAYATGPGCETDQQLVARLRPYLTERLASELSQSAAPPCGTLGPSVGQVVQLTSEGLASDGHLGFVARVEVTYPDSGQEETDGCELFLRHQADGWRVDEVRP